MGARKCGDVKVQNSCLSKWCHRSACACVCVGGVLCVCVYVLCMWVLHVYVCYSFDLSKRSQKAQR